VGSGGNFNGGCAPGGRRFARRSGRRSWGLGTMWPRRKRPRGTCGGGAPGRHSGSPMAVRLTRRAGLRLGVALMA